MLSDVVVTGSVVVVLSDVVVTGSVVVVLSDVVVTIDDVVVVPFPHGPWLTTKLLYPMTRLPAGSTMEPELMVNFGSWFVIGSRK